MQQGETQQEEEDFSWENEGSQFLKQRIFSLPRFPPFLTPLVCPDIRMNGKLFGGKRGRRRTKNNNHRPPPPNPSRPLFLLFLSAPPFSSKMAWLPFTHPVFPTLFLPFLLFFPKPILLPRRRCWWHLLLFGWSQRFPEKKRRRIKCCMPPGRRGFY